MKSYGSVLTIIHQFQLSPKLMTWLCVVVWWFVFSYVFDWGLDSLLVRFESVKVNHHSFTSIVDIWYSVSYIGETFNDNEGA